MPSKMRPERRAAIVAGYPRYFTAEPCHRGHDGSEGRYASSGMCVECLRENSRKLRHKKAEVWRAYQEQQKQSA
jgi:hypothetical protein